MQEGTPAQVTRSKGSRETFESYDGKFVFFAKLQTSGIFKMPVEGGEETQVLQQGGLNCGPWQEAGSVFSNGKDAFHPLMQFYSLRDCLPTTLFGFPRGTNLDTDGSASPCRRRTLDTLHAG